MESNRYDVVVVGAGLAGLTAACVAARQNLRVALTANGPGSFALGTGWLTERQMQQLSGTPEFSAAIAFFRETTRLADCPFMGDIENPRLLPTILGNFQSVALAPSLLWNAQPRKGTTIAIAGVRGLSSFDENFMAERMNQQAHCIGSHCTYTAQQIVLNHDLGIPVTPLRIARCFDRDPGFRAELTEALRHAASGFDCILVPGMLGICSSTRRILQLESAVGCPIGELPTLPPSIPSLRVFHFLESYLRSIGVEPFLGFPVEKIAVRDGSQIDLQVASPGHAAILRAGRVVLAAGRHSSGLFREIATNLFVAASLRHQGPGHDSNAMEILTGYRAGNLAAAIKECYAVR